MVVNLLIVAFHKNGGYRVLEAVSPTSVVDDRLQSGYPLMFVAEIERHQVETARSLVAVVRCELKTNKKKNIFDFLSHMINFYNLPEYVRNVCRLRAT